MSRTAAEFEPNLFARRHRVGAPMPSLASQPTRLASGEIVKILSSNV
jgi:hypothetical protein